MWPAVLGMTFAELPENKAGLAGGLILGVAGIGNALGPLIGGALTEFVSWRAILFLNVPIALIAIFAVWKLIHQPRPEDDDHKIDYGGIATVSLGLVIFMVALDQVVDLGWGDPRIIGAIVVSALLLTLVRLHRTAGGSPCPRPQRRHEEHFFHRGLRGDPVHVCHLLLGALLRAPVPAEVVRLFRLRVRASGCCRSWRSSHSPPSWPGRSTTGSAVA